MKLRQDQQAPAFHTTDVFGRKLNPDTLAGKRIYLAFERNAGCPVCILRTHQLLHESEYFAANNTAIILVFESTPEKMRENLTADMPFYFVADPQNKLYEQYGVERSLVKVMRGLLHGLLEKVNEGNKLFSKPTKQDGHKDRVPAEFIIREDGTLAMVHYNNFVGDHLPIEKLKTKLAEAQTAAAVSPGV